MFIIEVVLFDWTVFGVIEGILKLLAVKRLMVSRYVSSRHRGNVVVWLYPALGGGKWLAPRLGRFVPEIETLYPLYRRLSGPWMGPRNLLPPPPPPVQRFEPRTLQNVASFSTD